jgi:uncharacterized protein (TIGR03437 family)
MKRLTCWNRPSTPRSCVGLALLAAVLPGLLPAQTIVDLSQRRPSAGDFVSVPLPALAPSLLQSTVAVTRPSPAVPNFQFQPGPTPDFVFPHDYNITRWVDVKNIGAYMEVEFAFVITGPNGLSATGAQLNVVSYPQPGILYLLPNETQRIWVVMNWDQLDQSSWKARGVYDYSIVLTVSPLRNGQTPAEIQAQSQTVTLHNTLHVFSTVPVGGQGPPAGDNNAAIEGSVYDAATGKPIANAEVSLSAYSEYPFRPSTDAAGHYSIPVTAYALAQNAFWKPYGVQITAAGYADFHAAVSPRPGDAVRVDAAMTRAVPGPTYSIQSRFDAVLNAYRAEGSQDGKYFAVVPFHAIAPAGVDPQAYEAQAALLFFNTGGTLLWQFPLYAQAPAVAVSDDGSLVATARCNTSRADNGIYLLDRTGKVVWSVGNLGTKDAYGQPTYFFEVRISHDNRYLAAGDVFGNLYLLDIASQKVVWQRYLNGQVRLLAFENDNGTLYAGSGDGYFYSLRIDGTLSWRTYIGAWSTAFCMSRNYILAGGKHGYSLTLIDKASGQTLWQFPLSASPNAVAIAPDESYLAVVGSANQHGTLLFSPSGVLLDQDKITGAVAIAQGGSYMLLTGQDINSSDTATTWLEVLGRNGRQLWKSAGLDSTIDRGPLNGFAWISDDGRRMAAANGNWIYFLAQQGPGATAAGLTSAASYGPSATNGVSPGEFLTFFGQGLGPTKLTLWQLDSSGNMATLLAGTQVLFDNTPAPLLYTSSGQLSAIAPYDLAAKSTATITVEYQGLAAPPIDVAVASANPALFTLDSSGRGDAAIVRPDGSEVNAASPASPGDVLVLFAEGYGASTPALPDGAIVSTTWPVPVLNTVLLIDGLPVATLYCGAAPYMVNGVLQVNFQVPAVAPGAHRIQLRVGNRQSPTGVTLQTR